MIEHICETCKYSEPVCGALCCMNQKGMPYVRTRDGCSRWKSQKQTNADRIRSMTDEELAAWLNENDSNFPVGDRTQNWLDWLKEEAKE